MQKQIIKPVSRLQLALQIKSLKSEVKRLKNEIVKKDTLLHKKLCEIAGLKNRLESEKLTFRERLFGKKRKKAEPRRMINQSLKGLQDQVSVVLKAWYSDEELAFVFSTTKRNIRRFIKRNGLR